jgi:radical SAM protein with 4Fe4S-binding SPASM domain
MLSVYRNSLGRLLRTRSLHNENPHRVRVRECVVLPGSALGALAGTTTVAQSFVAHHDDLSAVSVRFGTYQRLNTKDIIFRLYDLEGPKEPVAEVMVNAAELDDNEFHDFRFQAIPASKGRTYRFTLASPDSTTRDAVTVYRVLREESFRDGLLELSTTGTVDPQGGSLDCIPRCTPIHWPLENLQRIIIGMANVCNLRCVHCLNRTPHSGVVLLPERIRKQVRDHALRGHLRKVALGYNDDALFVEKTFGGVIEYVESLDVPWRFDTNGNTMDEVLARRLLKTRLDYVNFSLDAAQQTTYERIRKRGIPLKQVLDNIRLLCRIKGEVGASNLVVSISFVLMKSNIRELFQAIDIAKDIGVDQVIGRHLTVMTDNLEAESLYNCREYYNSIRRDVLAYGRSQGVSVGLPPQFPSSGRERSGHRFCEIPWEGMTIMSNGDVLACCIQAMRMGNLHKQTLEDVWNGELFQGLRSLVNSDNPPAACTACPLVPRNLYNNPNAFFLNRVLRNLKPFQEELEERRGRQESGKRRENSSNR